MTIKEMEARSGMERATIRFYERQGLITPERMSNGYRDYTEDELQILLRVKLLRSLHLSLEEICALKSGDSDLATALARQISQLEQEKRDISYAREVCRAMQEEKATFETLDAAKYLAGIRRASEQSGGSYFAVKGDRLPQVFHPWRRYLARMLDLSVYNIGWFCILTFVFHVNLAGRSFFGNLLDSSMAIVFMLLLEPLWLRLTGTTPGKAIFGLRIEDYDGRRLSYGAGVERTWGVVARGLGYNIPGYSIVRLWKSYKTCRDKEPLPWDEGIDFLWNKGVAYSIKDTKAYRAALYAGGLAAVTAILVALFAAQRLPPNRGPLTVAQFVQNHNYYVKYLDIGMTGEYLSPDGAWLKKEWDTTIYLELGHSEKPAYVFHLENGAVRGVSFDIEVRDSEELVKSYDIHMLLASLAFIGAQKEVGLFSKVPNRIIQQIADNPFQSFSIEEAGVMISCDTAHSGYIDTPTHLWPEEDAEEMYFRLSFSAEISP